MGYLARRKIVGSNPGNDNNVRDYRINNVEVFTPSDVMYVNADTLASLQIIQSENHPNSHMNGTAPSSSGSKESLSIYGLFHHLAHTPQGRQKLRQIFLRPSLDLFIINERLNTISTFVRPDNASILEGIVESLKRIKDIRAVIVRLKRGISDGSGRGFGIQGSGWSSIQSFTFHTLKILEAIRSLTDSETLLITKKVSAVQLNRHKQLLIILVADQ